MEEAGQDVPSWLRGEADRFTKHEVFDNFVFISSDVCTICHTCSKQEWFCTNMSMLPPRLDRGRKAEEEEVMQEEVEGQVAVDASSVGRRLVLLSDGQRF